MTATRNRHTLALLDLLLMSLLSLHAGTTSASFRTSIFQISQSLSNRLPSSARWSVNNITSPAHCVHHCLGDDLCSAAFHDRKTNTCVVFGTTTPAADVMMSSSDVTVVLRQPPGCPVGEGYVFNASLRLCLKIHVMKLTWDNARTFCENQKEAGHLAIIRTWEEESFLRSYLAAIGRSATSVLHIGGYDDQGTFRWVDGTRVENFFYEPNHPFGNGGYPGLQATILGWHTGWLAVARDFLCQVSNVTY